MFSLQSPHRGDSNEYTQHTIFNIKKKTILNHPKSADIGFSKGLKNKFETAVVNEPSVFEPLKFYTVVCRLGEAASPLIFCLSYPLVSAPKKSEFICFRLTLFLR